ncbi:MAG: hypothetical protein WC879_17315 [Melioribacteraceae bacterium]
MKLFFFILLSSFVFGQVDISRMSEVDLLALQKQIEVKLNDVQAYQFSDFAKAIGYSLGSGISLGVFESNAFGYQYPNMKSSAVKKYLMWNTPTPKVFGKIFYPQKVSRESLYLTSRLALNSFKKFYKGNLILSYITWFIFHNTVATLYRDFASGKGTFYSFDLALLL